MFFFAFFPETTNNPLSGIIFYHVKKVNAPDLYIHKVTDICGMQFSKKLTSFLYCVCACDDREISTNFFCLPKVCVDDQHDDHNSDELNFA